MGRLKGIEVEVECTGYDEIDAEDVLEKNDPEDVIAYYGAAECLKLILTGKVKEKQPGEINEALGSGTESVFDGLIETLQARFDPYETKAILGKPMDAKERKIFEEMDRALKSLQDAKQYYRNSVTVELYCTGPAE